MDIYNLSLSHPILMGQCSEPKAKQIFVWIKEHGSYLRDYLSKLVLPIPDKNEQETCDKISVGSVIGVIDMISNDAIIDIKCCQKDDIESYKKQLFTYACLHHLRYKSDFTRCEIYNFITGKQFVMALGDSCKKYAKEHIKNLGSYCREHLKLFDK